MACGNPATAKISVGSIYYLPPRHELLEDQQSATDGIHPGVVNHPVLILSFDVWRSTIDFLVISSLDGKTLDEYTTNQHWRDALIPIFPSKPHPDSGRIAYLDTECGLPKRSYIRSDRKHTVPWGTVMPLFDQQSGRQLRLQDSSFQDIKKMSNHPSKRHTPPGSPGSSHFWPSSTSSIRSLGSPPPARLLHTYSQQRLLSLRSVASCQPGLIARLQTVQFDLTKRNKPIPTSIPSALTRSIDSSSTVPNSERPWLRYSAQKLRSFCIAAHCRPAGLTRLKVVELDIARPFWPPLASSVTHGKMPDMRPLRDIKAALMMSVQYGPQIWWPWPHERLLDPSTCDAAGSSGLIGSPGRVY